MSLMDRAILELEEIWQEERTFWSNYLDKDGNFCFVFGSAGTLAFSITTIFVLVKKPQ